MSLPSQLLASVACNVIVADSVLEEARAHLEFLGYAVERSGDGLFASQPGCSSWLLRDFGGGVLFRKAYLPSEAGRAHPEALLVLANRINAEALFLRCYVDPQCNLAFEAWYPNLYERRSFGHFVNLLERDLRERLRACGDEAEKLLG